LRTFSWRLNDLKKFTLIAEGFFQVSMDLQVNDCDLSRLSRLFARLVFGAESFFEISCELSEAFERLSESVVVVLELVEANSAIKQEK
jgi:hypothetical protein